MTIWKHTIGGKVLDLHPFDAAAIEFDGMIAESLARLCRFDGHVPGGLYSVAQHCALMADAALEETGDASVAAYCLLHDAHEAIIGDHTTPVVLWMDAMAVELYGAGGRRMPSTILAAMKDVADLAIWRAAGLPPPTPQQAAAVKDYDLRMLATEKRQLLMPSPRSWGEAIECARPIRMRGRIVLWPVAKAAEEWRTRLRMLCPNAGA